MSYRTFKRVLGETSLERKCRFLFGASLLLLILSSFLWCSRETEKIVYDKPRSVSRYLAGPVLEKGHLVWEADPMRREQFQELSTDLEDLVYESAILSIESYERPHVQRAESVEEMAILKSLEVRYRKQLAEAKEAEAAGSELVKGEDPDGGQISEVYKSLVPIHDDRVMNKLEEYRYYQPVYWKESCLGCHKIHHSEYLGELATVANASQAELIDRMPFRVVKVVLPTTARQSVHRIRAFLIAMGIVTVFLSMIALYIVVRYVIVKPLQHLQEVSEQVEHGNYDARAQIETRDEFEDLAGAFNRMLRHLVDTQAELKETNSKLDSNVDELAQANMQLYELNRLKSEFLASVSHELRTPLNSIIGFADVLKGLETLTEKQKRYASNIGSSGKVLLEMINDILDLAKMESGKMRVRPSEFAIDVVTRAQIDVVRQLAADKNIDISFNSSDDLPEVFQDQAKIQQILTNLLSNAIKFTPDGGRISVKIEAIGEDREFPEKLAITVQDTGIGIAEEDHEIIFEKFRQATPHAGEDNLTREFSGTGLGLSIIKELCKLLGGEIIFNSQLGHGSAFTAVVPWILSQSSVDEPTSDSRPVNSEASLQHRIGDRNPAGSTPTPNTS